MNRNKGFTLLELMIVVAIIGVIMSMAVPAFSDMIERNRLKSAVFSLRDDMQLARTKALKREQVGAAMTMTLQVLVSVTAGNAGAWCYGLSTGACDCTQAASAANCNIKIISGSGYSTTNITTAGTIVFDSRRGTATPTVAAGNVITFTTANYTAVVSTDTDASGDTIPDAGRVVICTPAGSSKKGLPTMPDC
jgi:prepilin-type N-terminal cleavage/methylation domain-containing protein